MEQIVGGMRVRYIGKTIRRGIQAGDNTTVIRTEFNSRQGSTMLIVTATRNLNEGDEVRVWPAELEILG